jgi:uncharacterized protein with HEPN domain
VPPREWRVRVADIVEAAERAVRYVHELTFDQFAGDARTVDAVSYAIVIGEAANAVPETVIRSAPEIPWADIRGMRNRVPLDLGCRFDVLAAAAKQPLSCVPAMPVAASGALRRAAGHYPCFRCRPSYTSRHSLGWRPWAGGLRVRPSRLDGGRGAVHPAELLEHELRHHSPRRALNCAAARHRRGTRSQSSRPPPPRLRGARLTVRTGCERAGTR